MEGHICFGKARGRSVGLRILSAMRLPSGMPTKGCVPSVLALLSRRHSQHMLDSDSSEQAKVETCGRGYVPKMLPDILMT